MAIRQEFVDFRRRVKPLSVGSSLQPMRVLLVAPYAPRGGGMGRIMAYLAAAEARPGIRLETVESRGAGSGLHSVWHVVRAGGRILRAAVRSEATIVHVNVAEGGSVVRKGALLLLARACGLRTVLHLHAADIIGFHARLPRRAQALMAAVFRRAHMCVVLGEPWRAWLADSLGVDPARITVVRNGVPRPALVRRPDRAAEFTFLFLGNLLARKGLVDLLHALASVQARIAHPHCAWRLIIAGGGDIHILRELARSLGLGDRVRFVGWLDRDATSVLLGAADALVLPSYQEALPLVLLEAASLGVPIIATPVGAVPELFTDEQDALLVSPGNRDALSGALLRLLTDTALAARLGANGRLLYEREFTMDNFTNRLAKIYARVCDRAA